MIERLCEIIKRFEGCRLKAYLCPAGIWTIGWGSTGPDIKAGVVWTQQQADDRLRKDAEKFARQVAAASPVLWFNEAAHVAIADFAYNLGIGRYLASTLKRKVDVCDWPAVRRELMKWVFGGGRKLRGLELRRAAEANLIDI